MKNILKFSFVIFLVVFSNIQNGYGYMRDCSWWSSHLLETTPEKVEKEIAKGLDIKGAYESRQSYSSYIEVNIIVPPLICAAKSDNIKVVEVLLKHGADVNGNGVDGETALMGAVHRRNFAMAEMLIKSGANVNAQDNNGDSILEYASNGSCSADGEKMVKYLLQNGANRDIRNNQGKTPLDNLDDGTRGYACDGMISILENYNPKDLKENHIFETILCVIAMIFIPLAAKKYDERQETKKNTNFSMDEGISETQDNDVSEISIEIPIEPTSQTTRRKRNVINSASKRKLELDNNNQNRRKLEL